MDILLYVRCLCASRWTEIQCYPVVSGNFTPSGSTVKVTSNHRVAKAEGFTFVVRLWPSVILRSFFLFCMYFHHLRNAVIKAHCFPVNLKTAFSRLLC